MRLDIGPGDAPLAGFVTVDYYGGEADVQAPSWSLPFPDDSVAVVHSSHQLEHVPRDCILSSLHEWRRVLAPGGELWLEVPDFAWCARWWLWLMHHEGDDPTPPHVTTAEVASSDALIFGQDREGYAHRSAWTAERLQLVLTQTGYRAYHDADPPAVLGRAAFSDLEPGRIVTAWSHEQQSLRVRCVVPD
jgi:predicted SAM-dependent methyltransferase